MVNAHVLSLIGLVRSDDDGDDAVETVDDSGVDGRQSEGGWKLNNWGDEDNKFRLKARLMDEDGGRAKESIEIDGPALDPDDCVAAATLASATNRCSSMWVWTKEPNSSGFEYGNIGRRDCDSFDSCANGSGVVVDEEEMVEISGRWWVQPCNRYKGSACELDDDEHLANDIGRSKATRLRSRLTAFACNVDRRGPRSCCTANHHRNPFITRCDCIWKDNFWLIAVFHPRSKSKSTRPKTMATEFRKPTTDDLHGQFRSYLFISLSLSFSIPTLYLHLPNGFIRTAKHFCSRQWAHQLRLVLSTRQTLLPAVRTSIKFIRLNFDN